MNHLRTLLISMFVFFIILPVASIPFTENHPEYDFITAEETPPLS